MIAISILVSFTFIPMIVLTPIGIKLVIDGQRIDRAHNMLAARI